MIKATITICIEEDGVHLLLTDHETRQQLMIHRATWRKELRRVNAKVFNTSKTRCILRRLEHDGWRLY